MKTTIKLFALVAMMVLSVGAVSAQKFAHVDYGTILAAMPAVKKADATVETLRKQYTAQGEALQKKMSAKYEEAMNLANTGKMTKELEAQYQAELEKLQAGLEKFSSEADTKIAKKRSDLLKPILDSVEAAVKSVAQAKGLAYVFDVSTLLYTEGGLDITADVRAKLGI